MSFMNTIKSIFSPAGGSSRKGNRSFVVDGARLIDEKTGRRMAPREQIQMLNALARIAKQESLEIQAVFESDRALREVEEGGDFNGVKVYFAPDTEQLVAKALKLCRGGSVLVSSGVMMESRATEAGIPVLSSSTFRKAFMQGGLPGGGRSSDRGRRRDRRRGNGGGNRASRGGNRSQNGSAGGNDSSSGSEESSSEATDNSAVRNLIDLVE